MHNDAKRNARKTIAAIVAAVAMATASMAAYAACNTYLAAKCKTKYVNCLKINGGDCEQKIHRLHAGGRLLAHVVKRRPAC